ncbi:hypothetical protein N7475_001362 [Penicillium sp. IBT 31633x]|nr:hypothetical protein N7475_001362 [Penicillium sp. IBT 31633x]
MSGLEIVGVVASTLQIAEIGMKLSVKLCSFYRQMKDADHSAQRLANDVSLTCSILSQLGKALEQDKETKLCSQQAFLTAQEVLGECEKIIKQVEETIEKKDPSSGRNKWERGTRKLTIVLLGPDLDILKSHLDRLKSTMLLMLNVIMYAREINRTSDFGSLEDQRMLIQTLLREKKENEAKLEKAIEVAKTRPNRDDFFPSSTLIAQPDVMVSQQPSPDSEIEKYHNLVENLLHEIDVFQSSLQQDRHIRIRDGMQPDFGFDLGRPLSRRLMPATRRASTGTLNLETIHKGSLDRYDRDDNISDDWHELEPEGLSSRPSRLEAYLASFHRLRDPHGRPTKETECRVQSVRHRSNAASVAKSYEFPVRLDVPVTRHQHNSSTRHLIRRRTPSPSSTDSDHNIVPASSRRRAHRLAYSTTPASDTGYLHSRHSLRNRTSDGTHQHRIHPDDESPKKDNDIDDIDAHPYTPPDRQFNRDYPIRPRHHKAGYRLYRPISINNAEDNPQRLPREGRQHGPPPTAWGLDSINHKRPQRPMRARDDLLNQHKPQNAIHDEALVAVPHDSDGEYPPYEGRRRRHRRRHHRSDSKTDTTCHDPENRHFKPHDGGLLSGMGLGTAALGGGYSDMSDYEHQRRSRRTHRRTHDEGGTSDDDPQNFEREPVVSSSEQHRYSSTETSGSDWSRSAHRLTRGVRRERACTSVDYSSMPRDGHTSEPEETKVHDVQTPQTIDTRHLVLFDNETSDEDGDDKDDTSVQLKIPPMHKATKGSDLEKKVSHSGERDVSDDIAMDTVESLVLHWTTLSRDVIRIEQKS